MPNDSSFVFGNRPFCKHVGDKVIIMYAFDQWHFVNPFVVGRTSFGGIVGG